MPNVGIIAQVLVTIAWLYIAVTFVFASLNLFELRWLNFLSALGYIKIGVTLIKCAPQSPLGTCVLGMAIYGLGGARCCSPRYK